MNKPKKSGLSKLQFQISGRVTYLSETASLVPLANKLQYIKINDKNLSEL